MEEQLLEEKRKKTQLVLSNVYNLPAMSTVMLEVSKLLDDPSTNTSALSQMVGKDPGLTTKILSIANSPLYGLPRKVATIDFAILIIGYQDIKNIVIALSMIDSFKNKNDKFLNQKEFWAHSVLTGNAAKKMAEDLGYRIGSEAFVSGLLHELGTAVIHKYFHSSFETIVSDMEENGTSQLEAEFNELGYTHQDIGKFLAEKWNLPSHHCEAIQKHHTPSLAEEDDVITAIVHLADYATQRLGIGSFYLDNNYELDMSVVEKLKFENLDALNEFVLGYEEIFNEQMAATNFV